MGASGHVGQISETSVAEIDAARISQDGHIDHGARVSVTHHVQPPATAVSAMVPAVRPSNISSIPTAGRSDTPPTARQANENIAKPVYSLSTGTGGNVLSMNAPNGPETIAACTALPLNPLGRFFGRR